jgi:hypothetical protein
MFSTVLKEITGYFGKSFLISVFFPSLFFWMLNLTLAVLSIGLEDVLKWWDGIDGQIQGFLAVGALIGVIFSAYVLHIFMGELTNVFQGRWPILKFFPEFMRKRSQEKWKKLRAQDEELGTKIQALRGRQEALRQLFDRDQPPLPYGVQVDVSVMAQEATALYDQIRDWTADDYLDNEKWAALEEQLSALQARILALSESELEQHETELSKANLLFRAPEEFLDGLISQMEQDRLAVYQEWSVAFPGRLNWVMPTRLGNHLRAAETYSFMRYNLDAAVVWPRLRETLPEKFAGRLGDAKTNMDLMIVLTTLALIIGLVWAGIFVFVPDAFLAVQKWVAAPIALVVSISIARVAYLNAAQSALAYGELLKTAFDLYRWDALKSLHLELPKDLASEKEVWGQVVGLLYRNYPFTAEWKHGAD